MDALKSVRSMTSTDAFKMTPNALLEKVPNHVSGVAAVAPFDSPDDLRNTLGLKKIRADASSPIVGTYAPGTLAVVVGREFLIPNNSKRSEMDLLKEALEVSGDTQFVRKRAAYWRWQREFLEGCVVLDQETIDAAAEEMRDLIDEESGAARRAKVKLGVSCVFGVAAAGLSVFC
jgi:hypothetical protein